jgi:hypothetical protein
VCREEIAWEQIACLLTIARFCAQRSELGIAQRWFCHTALENLLGVQAQQINDDRLYRGLDVLQSHKDRLCAHLLERLEVSTIRSMDLILPVKNRGQLPMRLVADRPPDSHRSLNSRIVSVDNVSNGACA